MRPIGFSTGAIAHSDFNHALELLSHQSVTCVELSALRWREVQPLLAAIDSLDLRKYEYVALHAPSAFTAEQEKELVGCIQHYVPKSWMIVLHPDTVSDWTCWRGFGGQLAIENMDIRKSDGRTVDELEKIFERVPDAMMCFDIGHARQCDASMTEAYRILERFRASIRQIHISEVNSLSQHDPVSFTAKIAFQQVAGLIPEATPVIVESRVKQEEIAAELDRVLEALTVPHPAYFT